MAKEATTALLAKAAEQYGTEPINIVKIEWDDVTIYYGDKTIDIDAISVQGVVLEFSTISNQKKSDSSSNFSSAQIVLADKDGALKKKVNTQILEGRTATIYQYFEGLDADDLFILLKGHISGDIIWSEGQRTLSFTVEHYVEDNEIGFAPTEDDVVNINQDAVDEAWPLCFGTVIKVPAAHVLRPPNGNLREAWISENDGIDPTILIEQGDTFPQNIEIDILVGAIKVRGIMVNDTFTVSEANLPLYTEIEILNRPNSDVHSQDSRVIWIQDDETRLVGQYCAVEYEDDGGTIHFLVNYCIAQYGNKCYFKKPWQIIITNEDSGANETTSYYGQNVLLRHRNSPIVETCGIPSTDWDDTYWSLAGGIWEPGSPNNNSIPTLEPFPTWQRNRITRGYWGCPPGMFIRQLTEYNDLYIANLIPSTEILEVYAYREYRDETIFAPIPQRYYTKHLNYAIAGQTVTALEFQQSLLGYRGENWDEGIYISLRSSRGPNVSDIIRWLMVTYSNLDINEASFTTVRTQVRKFWANFALFDQPNVIKICEDIAKQARCAVLLSNGEVKLKYLSILPTAEETIDEDNTDLKSLELSFTTIEDIVTKTINTWALDYTEREETGRKYIYKNNIDNYGIIEDEVEYFIYNIGLFAKISAAFWGYRKSNVWRNAKLRTYLEAIDLESFDAVTTDLDQVSLNAILAEINNHSHDTSYAPTISLDLTLGSKSGESDEYGEPIQDDNYWIGDPDYPANMDIPEGLDPGAGRNEVEYIVPTEVEGSSTGTDDDDDDEIENPYALVYVNTPSEVVRGTSFSVRIEIRDYNGDVVNIDKQGQLLLESTDPNDLLGSGGAGTETSINISFTNGIFESNSLYINTGSNFDQGNLVTNVPDFEPINSNTFRIKDPTTGSLNWDVCPFRNTTRGTKFTVGISGGAANQDVLIEFASTDTRDDIYIDDVLKGKNFTIQLDASGEYDSIVWEIRGGYADLSIAIIIVSDPNELLASDTCEIYNLSGTSPAVVSQSLELEQEISPDRPYIELAITGRPGIDETFQLEVTLYDADGVVIPGHYGIADIRIEDADGNTIEWIDGGPDSANYIDYLAAFMEAGDWGYDACELDITTATVSPIYFTATVAYDAYLLEDTIVSLVNIQRFVVTLNNYNLTRATNYTLTVQAIDNDGNIDTIYIPPTSLELLLTSEDTNDLVVPDTITNAGWADGKKSVTVQIIGGAATNIAASIKASEPESLQQGTVEFVVAASLITVADSTGRSYNNQELIERAGTPDSDPQAAIDWLNAQQTAKTDLLSETIISSSFLARPLVMFYAQNYEHHIKIYARQYIQKLTITFTPAQRAGAKSLKIRTPQFELFEQAGVPPYGDADWVNQYFDDAKEVNIYFKAKYTLDPYSDAGEAQDDILNNADFIINMGDINAQNIAIGNSANSPLNDIVFNVPLELLEAVPVTQNELWLWLAADNENFPYKYPEYESGSLSADWRGLYLKSDSTLYYDLYK